MAMYKVVSLSLNPKDVAEVEELKAAGYGYILIFRAGMRALMKKGAIRGKGKV